MKRIISFILAICILFSVNVSAAPKGNSPIIEYYYFIMEYNESDGNISYPTIGFMVRQESEKDEAVLYIKAEDLAKVADVYVGDSSSTYSYAQTLHECALVHSASSHVVRFKLNSDEVQAIVYGTAVNYTAPHKTLYENGVTWIPFNFAMSLFEMNAIAIEENIRVNSSKFKVLPTTNAVSSSISPLAFDWVEEVSGSEHGALMGLLEARGVSMLNKLLSFEPSGWTSVLGCFVGKTELYDMGYAEQVAKRFILPSDEMLELVEENASEAKDTYDDYSETFEDVHDILDEVFANELDSSNIQKTYNKLIDGVYSFAQDDVITRANKAMKKAKFEMLSNNFFIEYGKYYKNRAKTSINLINYSGYFLDLVNHLYLYFVKSERATAALGLYAENSEYNEADVFERYAYSDEFNLSEILYNFIIEERDDLVDDLVNIPGALGLKLEMAGFAWSIITMLTPIGDQIDSAESRMLSEYAIKYQNESLDLYFDNLSKCGDGDISEKEFEKMINSTYSFLKFSYVSRNYAQEALNGSANTTNQALSADMGTLISQMAQKNTKIAHHLTSLEKEAFMPSTVSETEFDDKPYIDVIKSYGMKVDEMTQDSVPIPEITEYSVEQGQQYIGEEEAIERVKKTITKWTAGLLGDYIDGIYSFEVIDNYYVESENQIAYVVQMYTGGSADALFFVPADGNEVWLGGMSDGTYFCYTDIDLLHASAADLLIALKDLSQDIIQEAREQMAAQSQTGY